MAYAKIERKYEGNFTPQQVDLVVKNFLARVRLSSEREFQAPMINKNYKSNPPTYNGIRVRSVDEVVQAVAEHKEATKMGDGSTRPAYLSIVVNFNSDKDADKDEYDNLVAITEGLI